MGVGFAPTWLRQVSPPASQKHFNHCDPSYIYSGGPDPQPPRIYTPVRRWSKGVELATVPPPKT